MVGGPPRPKEERGWKRVDKVVCGDAEWSDFLEGTVGATWSRVDTGLRNTEQSVLADRVDKVVYMFGLHWFGVCWEAWLHFLFFLGRFGHALSLANPSK